jgi:hypothetical protein
MITDHCTHHMDTDYVAVVIINMRQYKQYKARTLHIYDAVSLVGDRNDVWNRKSDG